MCDEHQVSEQTELLWNPQPERGNGLGKTAWNRFFHSKPPLWGVREAPQPGPDRERVKEEEEDVIGRRERVIQE